MSVPCISPARQYLGKRQDPALHGGWLIPSTYKDVSGESHWSLGHNSRHLFFLCSAGENLFTGSLWCPSFQKPLFQSICLTHAYPLRNESRIEHNLRKCDYLQYSPALEGLSVGDIYGQMFSEFPFEQPNNTLEITFLFPISTGQKKRVKVRSSSWPLITNRCVNLEPGLPQLQEIRQVQVKFHSAMNLPVRNKAERNLG